MKETTSIENEETLDGKVELTIQAIKELLEKIDRINPSYEEYLEFEANLFEHFTTLKDLAYEYLIMEDWGEIINIGRKTLEIFGIREAREISPNTPNGSIALTEAVNLSAKNVTPCFYALKPLMIVASWKNGAHFGLGEDEAYYLASITMGVASFHDPGNEVGQIIEVILGEAIPQWEHEWSGVYRQDSSIEILKGLAGNRMFEQVKGEFVAATSPEEYRKWKLKYLNRKPLSNKLIK